MRLAHMFYLCSHSAMDRVAPEDLATSLEIALSCSPPSIIAALGDNDRQRRQRATHIVAAKLAESLARVDCSDLYQLPECPELFGDASR